MDILYCGISPSAKYPGLEAETPELAYKSMTEQAFDIIVWNWSLGPFPAITAPLEGGLVLVSDRESLELYRFAARERCHQIVISRDPTFLEDAISQALESVQKRRLDEERSALFEKYGSHLNMHLWYDLIVEGKYESLVDMADFRLILFHQDISVSTPQSGPPPQTDSRTVLSEIFPEAIVILALQRGWECVVLPGNVRKYADRAPRGKCGKVNGSCPLRSTDFIWMPSRKPCGTPAKAGGSSPRLSSTISSPTWGTSSPGKPCLTTCFFLRIIWPRCSCQKPGSPLAHTSVTPGWLGQSSSLRRLPLPSASLPPGWAIITFRSSPSGSKS